MSIIIFTDVTYATMLLEKAKTLNVENVENNTSGDNNEKVDVQDIGKRKIDYIKVT